MTISRKSYRSCRSFSVVLHAQLFLELSCKLSSARKSHTSIYSLCSFRNNYLWCWIIFWYLIQGSAAGQWQGDDRDWRPLPDHPGAQLHQTLRPWDWQCPGQIIIGQKCLILPQLWIKSWHSLGESVIPDSWRSRSIVHDQLNQISFYSGCYKWILRTKEHTGCPGIKLWDQPSLDKQSYFSS